MFLFLPVCFVFDYDVYFFSTCLLSPFVNPSRLPVLVSIYASLFLHTHMVLMIFLFSYLSSVYVCSLSLSTISYISLFLNQKFVSKLSRMTISIAALSVLPPLR